MIGSQRAAQKRSFPLMIFIILLALIIQQATVFASGLRQGDFDCPTTLVNDGCDILVASQTAMNSVGSIQVEAYSFSVELDLDEEITSLMSNGSGSLMMENRTIIAADFSLEDATFTSEEASFMGNGTLRLVDHVVYLGISDDEEGINWVGIEVNLDSTELALFGGFLELIQELNDVQTVVSWAQDEDVVVDDTPMAVFYVDFSARGLLQSSVFVEWLAGGLTKTLSETIGEDLISPALATVVVSELANQLSEDIGNEYIFRITQFISLEDFLIQQMNVELDFTMRLDFLRGLSSELDEQIPEGITIKVNAEAILGEYDSAVTIEAPETYEDISDELVGVVENIISDFVAGLGISGNGETNTDIDGAIELTVGEPITGNLEADGNAVRYQFEASEGDVVQIGIRAEEASSLDTYVQLFDSEGIQLADNDDALNPPSELDLGALDSYIEYEITEDGMYVIEVSSVFAGDSGAYVLTLTIE